MFHWSFLVKFHLCERDHPNRVSKYRQKFKELNIEGFDFSNGFKWSDVQKIEKQNNLSTNIFQINFYQDGSNWRDNLFPIEISEKSQVELLTY